MADMELELLPLPASKSKSAIWGFFGFPAKDGQFIEKEKKKRNEVICKKCKKRFTYTGSTTNLISHLRYNHPTDYTTFVEQQQQQQGSQSASKQPSSTPRDSSQSSIKDSLASHLPLAHSTTRWKKLTEAVCYYIAKDMLPLDTVSGEGFLRMIKEFEPRYNPPGRKALTTNYLPHLYQRELDRVKNSLSDSTSFSMTADIWSSRANDSYIGYTFHYITDDGYEFSLKSHLLEVHNFPDSHTGENIMTELQEVFSRWSLLPSNLASFVTDNGSNIVRAFTLLGWPRVSCFSHTLQLAVEEAVKIPAVSKALARVRRLVTHFNHSPKATYVLKQKQQLLQHTDLTLIQDVSTRWNSAYLMVERFIKLQQPVCAALIELQRQDLMPHDSEVSTIEVYQAVMKPIAEITDSIGGEKQITFSAVRPLIYKLYNSYLKVSISDTSLGKTMKTVMHTKLLQYYNSQTLEILNIATLLDPRFKSLSFLEEVEKVLIRLNVQEKICSLFMESDSVSGRPSGPESIEVSNDMIDVTSVGTVSYIQQQDIFLVRRFCFVNFQHNALKILINLHGTMCAFCSKFKWVGLMNDYIL